MSSADAKKCNRIRICSVVSSVGECKELFSYNCNNAYLPKLAFQCFFTQPSVYGLSHAQGLQGGLYHGLQH